MEVVWDYPHESLVGSHEDGVTEPWIAEIISSLIKAKRPRVVVELGGFLGVTSSWIALAMQKAGGGELWVSEADPVRADAVQVRLAALDIPDVNAKATLLPSPRVIYEFENKSIDFAFVDNDHTAVHVEQEICALWPKMAPKGIIAFHDVSSDGVCQLGGLIRKYGGIALDLPRLGPDGGLGIIQVP